MEFMKKVEELSKKVGDTASSTYNTVADKSGKLIEETKLKIAISDKETDIDEIYEEIGKTVYNAYKAGEDVGKEFTKQGKKIDKLNEEIGSLKRQIHEIQIKNMKDFESILTAKQKKTLDKIKMESRRNFQKNHKSGCRPCPPPPPMD